jgi:acyl-coenzyme A synthetase/AMP-(fatty) acid ligase/acyl carrier protein
MTRTIVDWWHALASGPRDFLVTPAGTVSRKDFAQAVCRLAGAFKNVGIEHGDRVLIVCNDEPAAISTFCACLFDGLVPVMLTPDTPAARVLAVAQSIAPKAHVISQTRDGEQWTQTAGHRFIYAAAAPTRRWFTKETSFTERLASGFALTALSSEPRLPTDPEGLAYILFTSGTTGNPSGVMIRRRNLEANVATIARILEVGAGSRVFNDMVLAHADGLVQGPMLALGANSTLVRAGGFGVERLEQWLETIRREGATHFITVPTVWALIDRYAEHDDYFGAPGLAALSSVAANINHRLWERIETRFGRPLTNQYGLTETVTSALYAGPHLEAGRSGVGRAVDCEMRIVEQNGDGGDIGELQIRGDNVFAGYWQNPLRTEVTLTPDGWLKTGDLARADADGNIHIVGRLKTIIMSGGFLIRPEEVDEALTRHPSVISSVTVGMPDELFGEVPVSLIEAAPGGLSEQELTAHARKVLEPLKVPKRIAILDKIPRGDSGKPQLDAVRRILSGQVDAGTSVEDGNSSLEAEVIETAARVFRVNPASLSSRSTPETVPGWDSFQQVSLIVALEDRFGIRLPTSRAAAIRSLHTAIDAVRAARDE